ncbi:hypothetical protein CONPUDRAFT_140954 [Coniophora puteana RWD-64-598 SS2]|uniref:DUF7702 domain-containing protein n=1 Tax=Coniophora puteana (strain RWD-64-598) TaxID=741705 RepID=A0A5M3N4Y8_CONPW|nr:uncharacterized protein CONPUDRAFT_140954 [Coniophora puteana RWD-64-598 SS2]EIW86368.1 hypothetical protein CONPUDRAFT_140954 [Coniophora puteana RWD-64-598 SS2]
MSKLNTQGILALITAVAYLPFLFISFYISKKHGFGRNAGWVLLLIFSIIRVVGGALLVAAEEITPPNINLYIAGYACEASGVSPLLMCTLGLLQTVTQGPDGRSKNARVFRLIHLVGLAALVLTIIGISDATSSSSDSQSHANLFRRIGVLVFGLMFIILAAIALFLWCQVGSLMKHRRTLLVAITIALPFIGVRTLYSILSTFSSSSFGISGTSTTTSTTTNSLSQFNMFNGNWHIYVIMGMVTEYVAIIVYSVAGMILPLESDYKLTTYGDEYPLYPEGHYQYPQQYRPA